MGAQSRGLIKYGLGSSYLRIFLRLHVKQLGHQKAGIHEAPTIEMLGC